MAASVVIVEISLFFAASLVNQGKRRLQPEGHVDSFFLKIAPSKKDLEE